MTRTHVDFCIFFDRGQKELTCMLCATCLLRPQCPELEGHTAAQHVPWNLLGAPDVQLPGREVTQPLPSQGGHTKR